MKLILLYLFFIHPPINTIYDGYSSKAECNMYREAYISKREALEDPEGRVSECKEYKGVKK